MGSRRRRLTDFSAKFELRLHENRELIQGSISSEAQEKIAAEGFEPYCKHVCIGVKVREESVRNRLPKIAYTLLSLEPHSAPDDWPSPAVQSVIR